MSVAASSAHQADADEEYFAESKVYRSRFGTPEGPGCTELMVVTKTVHRALWPPEVVAAVPICVVG